MVVIRPRVILCEAVNGLNGSDPVFTNTSTRVDKFKYSISFDLPTSAETNELVRVAASGNLFFNRHNAEDSAVQNVFMKLYEEYGYIVEDYSSIRGNICRLRY